MNLLVIFPKFYEMKYYIAGMFKLVRSNKIFLNFLKIMYNGSIFGMYVDNWGFEKNSKIDLFWRFESFSEHNFMVPPS